MRLAFDVIGGKEGAVAVIEGTDKTAAKEIMERHKNVQAVFGKVGERRGEYRLYKLKLLAGKPSEVVHRESGLLFKLDPRKVYFSPRESTERQRCAELVGKKENILVLFAGAGPLAIAIAKKQPYAKVVAVEKNPAAVKYAQENVKLNRTMNVSVLKADAAKFKSKEKFDRIFMPLPEGATGFLPVVKKLVKPKGIVYLYTLSHEKTLFRDVKGLDSWKIVGQQRVLPYAPRVWKVRIDLRPI
ncbi:MAG: methyltransferase [Candidatus Aenigmarchaeota archaeon]|nr:methyltransferase [Candidatus Aenigmarchaeota archaeon]